MSDGALRKTEWWVPPVRRAALAVFLAVPVVSLLVRPLAGRLVWTIAIAALPLFIVLVGYHRWRRICPLAFFSQIPVLLRRPGTRRASPWLQANAYYVSFAVFFVSLWIRLIATNGNGPAIAAFFILIALAALLFGVLFTGKTWCNYVCPLSFIEKVYTEPRGLRETPNSQCAKCTACKPACPDINEENGYWREIESSAKRFVYFAYPGIIFGFYFYYYLQSGTWDYYFGGRWTYEPSVLSTSFFPGSSGSTAGFFFLPRVPRALASALTLAVFALLSFAFFAKLEPAVGRWLQRHDQDAEPHRARHILVSVSAFVSFVTFYTFAGQPTLRLIPWMPQIFGIVIVLVASLFLARRFDRTRQFFAEETVARSLLKRWEWTDLRPPKALHDAYLIHTVRSQERAMGYTRLLEIYTEALRESLASGLVTREEVQQLEALRGRLQIKPADHERIMAALAEEERARLTDPARHLSLEKHLQLKTYARALEGHLGRVLTAEDPALDPAIGRLQAEYGVTPKEHSTVLDQILGGGHVLAEQLAGEVSVVERASQTIGALEAEPTPAHALLADLLRRRRVRAVDRLLSGLHFQSTEELRREVREGLTSDDAPRRAAALELLSGGAPASIAERLRAARGEAASQETPGGLADRLRAETVSLDPYARAAAIHALALRGGADEATLEHLIRDEHEIVRATALRARVLARPEVGQGSGQAGPAGIESILALRAVPIFSRLTLEGLARLAGSSAEAILAPGEVVCREGEPGEEVLVLLEGELEVVRGAGPTEERLGVERVGGVIGEMAVLDPAPRAATVRAGAPGARIMRLAGGAFRDALAADPSVAEGVMRTLARRLRGISK
jgi:hypothetical protein